MLLSHDQRQASELGFGENGTGSHRMTKDQDSMSTGPSIPTHPLGLKPLGNKYFFSGDDARDSLKGALRILPDEVLMQLLEFLDQRTLRLLGYTCRFLFASCISDDLWKAIFLESALQRESSFEWRGSWRSTVLGLSPGNRTQIDCSSVFSDVLHRPFVCSHISLTPYKSSIPVVNEIDRLQDLSYAEFAERWSNKPFILTDCIKSWPVYQSWSLEVLAKLYPDISFRAEAVGWTFRTYSEYMADNHDESPLYLFDKKFAEKMGLQIGANKGGDLAYWNPQCFGSDLFEVLGAERPAHRWLIIGPERSGSTFHKDPNATSAWNAVIQGEKYWIMFPPSACVPGVFVSKDNSEVTSPLSIAEWLLEFHAEARRTPGCREGVCKAGEILHVPSGWWHLVVNVEAGIALTQNFVPKSHLADVLSFLRDRPEQVSGFDKAIADPYSLFTSRLEEEHPELLQDGLKQLVERQKKRRWDLAVGGNDAEEGSSPKKATGFSFGFGFGDEDEEIP